MSCPDTPQAMRPRTACGRHRCTSSARVKTCSVIRRTVLAGGGTRESMQTYTYNTYGEVLSDSDVPDTSNAAEDTCTATSYYTDTTDWVLDLPQAVEVLNLPCTTFPSQASQLVSDTQYTYDNGGDPTKTQVATLVSYQPLLGFQFTFTTEETASYDEYGRVLTSTDADNRTTTTAYTPATGAEPTSVQVTDPQNLVTTTTYDPARDLPLTITDPASYQTADAYDALGRVTGVWKPGNPASGPAVDKYTYAVSNTAPSVTTEQAEEPSGGYLTTQTLYDSLGQVRETQSATAAGGTPAGIPILVGGSGERRTLALVAKYADACNLFGDLPTIRHKLEVLDRHCAAVGLDPDRKS